MGAEATLNVRLNRELKQRGDAILSKEGLTPSKAVRSLYSFMEDHQTVPDCLKDHSEELDVYERRRQGIKRLVGVVELPDDYGVDQLKSERMARFSL